MNKQLLLTIAVLLAIGFKLSAQTQIDHAIQLTGTGANAEITGVKTVLNGQDAVNDSSVQRDLLKYALATGVGTSGSPYAVNLSPAPLAGYTTGMVVYFQAPAACGYGPVYVNVNSLGSIAIKKSGSTDLAPGDIGASQLVTIQYDGTNFEMLSQLGNPLSPLFTHYVGQQTLGGIVVAVWDSSGYERGLIASLVDLSTASAYSNVTTAIGATAESYTNGSANTAAIITASGYTSGAAFLCHSYNAGGYTDWYLPSILELLQIYNSASVTSKVLGANGFQTGSLYWSSTENTTSQTAAYRVEGIVVNLVASVSKTTAGYSVRAVRRY